MTTFFLLDQKEPKKSREQETVPTRRPTRTSSLLPLPLTACSHCSHHGDDEFINYNQLFFV